MIRIAAKVWLWTLLIAFLALIAYGCYSSFSMRLAVGACVPLVVTFASLVTVFPDDPPVQGGY